MPAPEQDTEPHADLLQRYLERALEIQERGDTVVVEAVCQAHPELAAPLRDALEQQLQLWDWADGGLDDPLAGQTFSGRYRLTRRLGAGAMGAVYQALDLELRRGVAVKVLQPYLFGDPGVEQRFQREAEVLAKLRHPNVVAVFDRGATDQNQQFLVMELLDGAPLADILDRLNGRDPATVRGTEWLRDEFGIAPTEQSWVRQGVRWALELAAGLSAAHAAGVFHRDVKPSNVFVTRDGRALLLDFGIAAQDDDATLTRGDTTLGTPKYMAPEQASKSVAPNPQLDVYSLAATLYHVLSGRAPDEGDARTVIAALQREEPPALRALHRGLFPDLVAVVECGMARALQQRYPSAQAFGSDLEAFLQHRPVTARYRGPLSRAWRRARRSRWVRLTAGGLLVAAAAQTGSLWLDARGAAREARHLQLRFTLPPTLSLTQRYRRIEDPARRAAYRRHLTELVATNPGSALARTYLAAFLADQGELRAASAQLEAVASQLDSPHVRALALRYARAEDVAEIDTADLPAPANTAARAVAGFHALRRLDFVAAAALLDPEAEDAAVRELALDAAVGRALAGALPLQDVTQQALAVAVYQGGHSARTLHTMAFVLAKQERFPEAMPFLLQLARLLPDDYPTQLNLGTTLRRLGDFDAALEPLRSAHALRPREPKPLTEIAKVLAAVGRYDEALVHLGKVSAEHDDAWRGVEARAAVDFFRAVDPTLPATQRAAAAEAMVEGNGRALDLLDQARTAGHAPTDYRVLRTHLRINRVLGEQLVAGSVDTAVEHTMQLLALDPINVPLLRLLRNLVQQTPDGGARVDWISSLIETLAAWRGNTVDDGSRR